MGLLDIFKSRQVKNVENTINENIFYNERTELAFQLYNDEYNKSKLKLPRSIVDIIVNSAAQEFDFSVDTKELQKLSKYIRSMLKSAESDLLIGGQVAFKPYVKGNKVSVAIYDSRDFVAYYDIVGELEKIYFKSDIRESEFKSYTLVEIHTYNENTREYRIDYQLYESANTDYNRKTGLKIQTFGSKVPLTKCAKTAELQDFVVIPDVDRHLCSVACLDNTLAYNKGESIYASSIELIKDAEKQYDSLRWEYTGGELAIDANSDLFRPVGTSRQKYVLPEGKERLYRRLDGADNDFKMELFAPQLRDQSYINGLNEILRKIENNTSLYSGALSNVQDTQKTASEVIASKQRFYVLVMMIKNKMRNSIQEILENCCIVYNRMMPEFMGTSVNITFDIGDSVIDIIDTGVSTGN